MINPLLLWCNWVTTMRYNKCNAVGSVPECSDPVSCSVLNSRSYAAGGEEWYGMVWRVERRGMADWLSIIVRMQTWLGSPVDERPSTDSLFQLVFFFFSCKWIYKYSVSFSEKLISQIYIFAKKGMLKCQNMQCKGAWEEDQQRIISGAK